MQIEFGLSNGDHLLRKGVLSISERVELETLGNLKITHQIEEAATKIIIKVFGNGEK